jgi:hypothetical protein
MRGYEAEIEKLTTVEVKFNMLVAQNLEHKIEGY